MNLPKLVNSPKGVSSRYLRAEYTGRINRTDTRTVFWSPSYFAGSRGGAPPTIVWDHIENQKRPVRSSPRSAEGSLAPRASGPGSHSRLA
ncbi:transposase [Streptomyces sp. NPDC002599]|uniref:transposase n=1 Tax=Streptomyces sp. NPDC002599 TaxID=3154421 RepID=UPI003330F5BB